MKQLTPTLRFGIAWMALVFALAIHVVDEMATGFLPFYNSLVASIPADGSGLSMPGISLPTWLNGSGLVLVALLLSTPLVFEGKGYMRPIAFVFSGLMVLNAAGHIGASFYLGKAVPGVYSSPLLLVAAVFLLQKAHSAGQGNAA